jgi:hypothetical protein
MRFSGVLLSRSLSLWVLFCLDNNAIIVFVSMLGVHSLAAVACGTACVLGAPFGALVFSMEVTASYYLVRFAALHAMHGCT